MTFAIREGETADPLQNPEAEIWLLCDLIANNRLIDPAADRLRPVDFAVPLHGFVFGKMVEEAAAGRQVDAVTLAPFFSRNEDWPALERTLSAAELNAGPRERTKAYLEQICDLGRRRRMVRGLQDVVRAARAGSETCDELIVLADEAVAELVDEGVENDQAPAATYAEKVIESFGKPITGVKCGNIGSLDKVLGYLRPGEFIVAGGRPGMGKTSVACSYAWGAATLGHPVLFFSLEMSADELTRRLLADLCYTPHGGVEYEKVRDGRVTGDDLRAVLAAKRRLAEMPLEISDRSGLTIATLTRRVRRHKRRLAATGQKLALVIVDYLQLMQQSRAGLSPYEHASEVSKALKTLAKNEGLAVMALAQLSRNVEQRVDHRPIPSDLRDSGQIEQDADAIVFFYREEEYLRHQRPSDEFSPKFDAWRTEMDAAKGKIEFIVPKRRNAATGQSLGWFFGEFAAVRGADFYRSFDEVPYG
ncbi:MAG: replicative DNA helicase [Sphingobium sp.]